MRIASIDIGTNTVLLLIADIDAQGKISTLTHQQQIPRLGKNVDKDGSISDSTFDKIADVLLDYKRLIEKYNVEKTVICATSAVRDSINKKDFIDYLKNKTNLTIEIISGDVEALLSYKGAISGLPYHHAIVLDIGGGSTEFSYVSDKGCFQTTSLQIGVVRLTERFIYHDPPFLIELVNLRNYLRDIFTRLEFVNLKNYHLIGVAGTLTTLACLDQSLYDFDMSKVGGYKLTMDRINFWFDTLSQNSSSEIRSLSKTTEGREDILTAGVAILQEFMKHFKFNEIIVSERGLRYGMIVREFEKQ